MGRVRKKRESGEDACAHKNKGGEERGREGKHATGCDNMLYLHHKT